MKQWLCLLLSLMLCVALLPLPGAMAASSETAPTIRVYLKQPALTDRADLTFSGLYQVTGSSGAELGLARNSTAVVQIADGHLILYSGYVSIDLGTEATFRRMASDTLSTDGLRFTSGGNIYPGDLKLTISGGILIPILTLSVEDYLQGVVPYEMSNSFPLEALKAQAVCARTYALSHVRSGADYDVVDTTADQVFRGINFGYTTAIRAVQETAGIVGTYQGELVTCYYSASNGGQTELPRNVWGSDNTVYAMTDDPYDLENEESVVRSFRLSRNGSALPEALTEAVREALSGMLAENGYDTAAGSFRVDTVTDVTLEGTTLAAPSRYMDTLILTLTCSARKPVDDGEEDYTLASVLEGATTAPTEAPDPGADGLTVFEAVPGTQTVRLALFPTLAEALGLDIPDTSYPMMTVTEEDNAFLLQCRRYGHGVGMSQRGAQQMAAKYEKTYEEILAFYYPKMKLTTIASGAVTAPTARSVLFGSPAPAASPTPRPTLMPVTALLMPAGSWLASVENIEDDSSLNLRAEPSGAGQILMRLYKHQQLVVLEELEDGAWAHVKTDVIEGYVMTRFLEKVE